jgi:hypothetical protein
MPDTTVVPGREMADREYLPNLRKTKGQSLIFVQVSV